MKQPGGVMLGVYVLLGVAVLLIIGAVFVYSGAENNSFTKFNDSVVQIKGDVKKCVDNYEKLSPAIEELSAAVRELKMQRTVLNEELGKALETFSHTNDDRYIKAAKALDVMAVRQTTMDKRIAELTGELKASAEKEHKVKITTPVEIIYLEHPPKPIGQGQDSLLKRSGIVPTKPENK